MKKDVVCDKYRHLSFSTHFTRAFGSREILKKINVGIVIIVAILVAIINSLIKFQMELCRPIGRSGSRSIDELKKNCDRKSYMHPKNLRYGFMLKILPNDGCIDH